MTATPHVFISATTSDLATARKAAADALVTLGCLPVVQDHFPPDTRTVRLMLRGKISNCHAVLHIVGFRYGTEPDQREVGEPRRSYTQMEFDTATELSKALYLFLLDESFPFNDPDAPPEDDERHALQMAHREAVKNLGPVYTKIDNEAHLREKVRELQVHVEELKRLIEAQRKTLEEIPDRVVVVQMQERTARATANLLREQEQNLKWMDNILKTKVWLRVDAWDEIRRTGDAASFPRATEALCFDTYAQLDLFHEALRPLKESRPGFDAQLFEEERAKLKDLMTKLRDTLL